MRAIVLGALALAVTITTLWVGRRFSDDVELARARAAQGSVMAQTRCGAIEYQEAGSGTPLLMIHGSGGGHDQGMAWARPLVTPIASST